jgi:hypothetical protein
MSTIVTRTNGATAKGSSLTHQELDDNFINLNDDKYQSGDDIVANTVSVSGGSSTDFLKADGSTDSTTYGTIDDATALAIALG